ncbi:MAG: hypothetical protein QGI26_08635 [Myxococcota bacterium]|nr:hypothetical protein [Myxococcota bacterium]
MSRACKERYVGMASQPTLQLVFACIAAITLAGCVSVGPTAPAGVPPPGGVAGVGNNPQVDPSGGNLPPDPTAQTQTGNSISAANRAQTALESMMMGAVVGSIMGPIGMAAGAGTALIYGAVTGNVLFSGSGGRVGGGGYGTGPGPSGHEAQREASLEAQLDGQVARGDALEDEIEAELQRQELLLDQLEHQETLRNSAQAAIDTPITDADLQRRVDPRSAPLAPKDRPLPAAIFEEESTTIPKKSWDNDKKLKVVKRSLDADRDGNPEQVRYFDQKSGKLIRKEQDRDYDGKIDSWTVYEADRVVSRNLDNDGNGKLDVWEFYAQGRMTRREVDRDGDGVRDAFYTYSGDELVQEHHDADNDGKPDLRVTYESRRRVATEEDTDRNGAMDSWTRWAAIGDREIMVRTERDTDGDGKRDVFETYEPEAGRPILAKREEDKDGDGNIDVTSIYENGKLKSREISDPGLVPL